MKIKTSGYYLSEPFHWIDWNASIKFEGNNFYILKFENNKCYFDSVNELKDISIENLANKENYGIYKIKDTVLEILYNANTEFEVTRKFTIITPELLLDENLKEYKHIDNSNYYHLP